ncbi:heparanase-like, partial [Saccoglossus kowalevskii]
SDYPHGPITIYALSLHTKHDTEIILPNAFSELSVDEYLLTPHDRHNLTVRIVDLNGVAVRMINNHTLPDLSPRHIHPGENLILPPLSFAFYVIPNAMAMACL